MMKIKEFKGKLNSIFDEEVTNITNIESNVDVVHQTQNDSLPIDTIKPRGDQPRKTVNDSSLNELAQSIKSQGVIQPIIVRSTENGLYEIIAGERRWRAAQKAGLDKIPAIIREYNKADGLAVALIENIQRENLNPLEEAQAIQSLLDECDMTHAKVAESIGKSRSTVSNMLRLLDLNEAVKTMMHSGLLEMGHARALLILNAEQQVEAATLVVGNALSVRETEKLVQRLISPKEKNLSDINPIFEKKAALWKAHLSRMLSSNVNVHINHEGKGKVVINFDSIEEADWMIKQIGSTETQEIE